MVKTSEAIRNIRIFKFVLLASGMFVGLWHLGQVAVPIFTARNNEPIGFWIFILAGPLSTFPASLVSFLWPRIGGAWLIGGSFVSLLGVITVGWSEMDFTVVLWPLRAYSAPMFVLGFAAITLEGKLQGLISNHEQKQPNES